MYFEYVFSGEISMSEKRRIVDLSGEAVSGRDLQGSSLLAMLVGGLVLVAIGAIVVMMFV